MLVYAQRLLLLGMIITDINHVVLYPLMFACFKLEGYCDYIAFFDS